MAVTEAAAVAEVAAAQVITLLRHGCACSCYDVDFEGSLSQDLDILLLPNIDLVAAVVTSSPPMGLVPTRCTAEDVA